MMQSASSHSENDLPQPGMVLLEVLETLRPNEMADTEWPTFTRDVHSRYSFFTTHSADLFYFSLEPWLEGLERELQNESTVGADFRLQIFAKGTGTLRERILHMDDQDFSRLEKPVAQCVVLQDSDLGYFILTASSGQPYAVVLDSPIEENTAEIEIKLQSDDQLERKQIVALLARSPYQPPETLWAVSSISNFIDTHVPGRHKRTMKEEIRLSPITLEVMAEAHKVLSHETYQLGVVAADLFRRCERMIEDLRDQIHRVNETALRVDQMNDEDADDYQTSERPQGSRTKIEDRLNAVREKQRNLLARHEALRKKTGRIGGKDISDKEKAWAVELDKLKQSLLKPEREDNENGDEKEVEVEREEKENSQPLRQPWRRFTEVTTSHCHLIVLMPGVM